MDRRRRLKEINDGYKTKPLTEFTTKEKMVVKLIPAKEEKKE